MSTSSQLHAQRAPARPARAASSDDPVYLDWGPDLPARYGGGRARLMVANPTTLFVSWESDLAAPERWIIETALEDGGATMIELPGGTPDAWLTVPPRSRGVVRLGRVEHDGGSRVVVATLPFTTPAVGPSAVTTERWGQLDAETTALADAEPLAGTREDLEASAASGPGAGSSSSPSSRAARR